MKYLDPQSYVFKHNWTASSQNAYQLELYEKGAAVGDVKLALEFQEGTVDLKPVSGIPYAANALVLNIPQETKPDVILKNAPAKFAIVSDDISANPINMIQFELRPTINPYDKLVTTVSVPVDTFTTPGRISELFGKIFATNPALVRKALEGQEYNAADSEFFYGVISDINKNMYDEYRFFKDKTMELIIASPDAPKAMDIFEFATMKQKEWADLNNEGVVMTNVRGCMDKLILNAYNTIVSVDNPTVIYSRRGTFPDVNPDKWMRAFPVKPTVGTGDADDYFIKFIRALPMEALQALNN